MRREKKETWLIDVQSRWWRKVHAHTRLCRKSVAKNQYRRMKRGEKRIRNGQSPLYPVVHADTFDSPYKRRGFVPENPPIHHPMLVIPKNHQHSQPTHSRPAHHLSRRNTPHGCFSSRGVSSTCAVTFTKTASGRESDNRTSQEDEEYIPLSSTLLYAGLSDSGPTNTCNSPKHARIAFRFSRPLSLSALVTPPVDLPTSGTIPPRNLITNITGDRESVKK